MAQGKRSSINEGIEAVHRLGGLAGLAHPFRIGSPACTGCFWEYEIGEWSAVDYIEVWSGTFAPIQAGNQRALSLWTNKLNEGHRIAAVSGRDWHAQADTEEPLSVTYLGVPEDVVPTDRQLIQALRNSRASVTLGPLLELEADLDNECIGIGAVIPQDMRGKALQMRVKLDFAVRPGLWTLPDQRYRMILRSDQGMEADRPAYAGTALYRITVSGKVRKWLRAELWGSVHGANTLIAFTNAIYFD